MDHKNLQEAQKRGDLAAVAFYQNSIHTQMQMLASLQQAAASQGGGAGPDPSRDLPKFFGVSCAR